jgi:hypothetical protein
MSIPALMFAEGGWCEALKTSYRPGSYQPLTADEYKALAPFAIDAPGLEEETDTPDKDALVARAVELGVGSQSVLARWGAAKLTAAIAEAEAK